jgi:hypothetical protein
MCCSKSMECMMLLVKVLYVHLSLVKSLNFVGTLFSMFSFHTELVLFYLLFCHLVWILATVVGHCDWWPFVLDTFWTIFLKLVTINFVVTSMVTTSGTK